jgi:hypothetical protein
VWKKGVGWNVLKVALAAKEGTQHSQCRSRVSPSSIQCDAPSLLLFCRFVLPSIRFVTAPTCPGTQSPTPSNIGHDKYQCGTERGMLAQSRDLGTLMHRKPNPSQTLACHTVGIPDTARVRDLMISLSKPSCSHSRLMCFERVAMHALHTCAQGVDTLQHL